MNDAPDWPRLATAVRARREELRLSRHALQAAGAPSVATLQTIEGADARTLRNETKWNLEDALQWQRGSVDEILGGGQPTAAEPRPRRVEVISDSPSERILVEIVSGASALSEKDRLEVLALIRAKLG